MIYLESDPALLFLSLQMRDQRDLALRVRVGVGRSPEQDGRLFYLLVFENDVRKHRECVRIGGVFSQPIAKEHLRLESVAGAPSKSGELQRDLRLRRPLTVPAFAQHIPVRSGYRQGLASGPILQS